MPSCVYWGGVYPDTPEVVDRGGVIGGDGVGVGGGEGGRYP